MTTFPAILAENFDGLWIWVFGLPVMLILGAGLSFIPSLKGHWAGPALAAPAIGLGLLFFLSVAFARAPFFIMLLSLLPIAVGIGSIALWTERRKRD